MLKELNYDSHSFSVELASKIGLVEALVLGHLYHWCVGNSDNEDMFKDGHVWVYITRKRINEQYPYLTEDKIRGALNRLEKKGLILVSNYNKIKIDKTNWYALTNEAYGLFGTSLGKITDRWGKSPSNWENTQAIQTIKQNYKNKSINKEIYKEIVDFWNNSTKSFAKVHVISEKIKSAINSRIRDGYSVDDIKKAILLCESLPDFYKGGDNGKAWKASFMWLISNTKGNFDSILSGALHNSPSAKRDYDMIINLGDKAYKEAYTPSCDGISLFWNDNINAYCTTNNPEWGVYDGYKPNERPNGATVYCQGVYYNWNSEKKEWKRKPLNHE